LSGPNHLPQSFLQYHPCLKHYNSYLCSMD
jgi:hypothetical protein